MSEKSKLYNFIYNAPKIELHLHLEGSVSLNFWNTNYSFISSRINEFSLKNFKNLPLFLEIMELIHKSLKTPEDYYNISIDLLDQLIIENVKYVEITWAPGAIFEFHKIKPSLCFKAIKKALSERKHLIDAKIIVDIIRNQPLNIAQEIMNWLSKESPDEVIGINFGGDEERFKVDPFLPIFSQAKDLGLGVTIHSGEALGEKSLIEDIRKIAPNRVGHATSLASLEAQQMFIAKKIHIEACPTSNYILGYLSVGKKHIVLENQKISSSINTDDRTFFQKSLTDEIYYIMTNNMANLGEIARMQINAIESAFCKNNSKFKKEIYDFWVKQL